MLKVTNLFSSATQSRTHLAFYVSVRWRRLRKPFWLGVAKTKMFKIPMPKKIPDEEQAELDRLQAIYARQLRALTNFMKAEASTSIEGITNIENTRTYVEEGLKINKEWNEQTALLRAKRLERENKETEERILRKILEQEEIQKTINERATEIVRTHIELSKTFVTEENLDKVIDECLSNVKDFNFALDLNGNIYKGRSNKPDGNLMEISLAKEEMIQPGDTKLA